MTCPNYSRRRASAAMAVAIIADGLQLPLNAAFLTGLLSAPAETAIILVDMAAFVLLVALLGFHWRLVPSFAAEAVPGLDLLPGWTASVLSLTWKKKQTAPELPAGNPYGTSKF